MDTCKGTTNKLFYYSHPSNECQKPVLIHSKEAKGKQSAEVEYDRGGCLMELSRGITCGRRAAGVQECEDFLCFVRG